MGENMKMLHTDGVKIFAKICLLIVCFYLGAEYWLWEWAALLISCLYALRMPKRKAFFVIFISYFVGCFNEQYILPVIIYWQIVGIEAAVFSISMILLPAIRKQCPPGVALFTFSSIFVLGEYLISLYSPHGTIGSIAYTQTENLVVAQLASVTGLWGISFFMVLLSAQLALLFLNRSDYRTIANYMVCGILCVVVIFGLYRLEGQKAMDAPGFSVGLASVRMDLPEYIAVNTKQNQQVKEAILQRYKDKIASLAQSGAAYILLPEKIMTIADEQELALFTQAAAEHEITLILGVTKETADGMENKAYVINDHGRIVATYAKQHLQTEYEKKYKPGHENVIWDQNKALAICKDMDFTKPAAIYSKNGAGIMFVPALDFHDDAKTHKRIAIMRGIEGDYAVVRAAQWGDLSISDSRGREIAVQNTDESLFDAELIGTVSAGTGKSLYSKIGDLFVGACLAEVIVVLLRIYRNRRKFL